jgi:hypothetical protein
MLRLQEFNDNKVDTVIFSLLFFTCKLRRKVYNIALISFGQDMKVKQTNCPQTWRNQAYTTSNNLPTKLKIQSILNLTTPCSTVLTSAATCHQ